jgi:L-asparaginase II
VSSREEAVAAWREGRRPAVRLRRAFAGLFMSKVGLAAGGVAVVIAVGVGVALALGGDDGATPGDESVFNRRINLLVISVDKRPDFDDDDAGLGRR